MRSSTLVFLVLAAVLVACSVASLLDDPKEFRGAIHRLEPTLFPLVTPHTPFTDETHDISVTEVLRRFARAAALALLQDGCRSIQSHTPHQHALCSEVEKGGMLAEVLERLQRVRTTESAATPSQDPPYFGFVPSFLGKVVAPDGAVFQPTACNTTFSILPTLNRSTGVMTVRLDAYRPTPSACVDDMMLTVGPKSASARVEGTGTYVTSLTVDLSSPAALWDATVHGVRVFRHFNSDPLARLLDTIDTLLLFLPMLTNHLDPISALSNVNFISNYSLMRPYPVPRAFPNIVNVSTSEDIHDGDLFAKMELDGLGPIEAFAQGTTSGHTAFAIRNQSTGQLFVCESVEQGITCTDYNAWIENMQSIGANIVMSPLDPALRAVFNNTAAWEHVQKYLGNEYGYFNFFFGWVDTEEKNFPCFPWEWDRCLSSDIVEYVMLFLDASIPEVASTFFGQALNHRANTGVLDMSIADVAYYAGTRLNMSLKTLMTVPEDDSWLYNSTRRGEPGRQLLPSEVCSTFACSTLRAAGVFEHSINSNITCTEIDVWDMFSMKIFDTARMGSGRPQSCINADPENNLCQLSGTWTFRLIEDANTRPVEPQMSLRCASRNPVPYDREGC